MLDFLSRPDRFGKTKMLNPVCSASHHVTSWSFSIRTWFLMHGYIYPILKGHFLPSRIGFFPPTRVRFRLGSRKTPGPNPWGLGILAHLQLL